MRYVIFVCSDITRAEARAGPRSAFNDPKLLAAAMLVVLVASGVPGVLSLGLGRALWPTLAVPGAAQSADEAECSTRA